MTRYVLGSHENTAHVWAQNSQTEGRAGDNRMFFERGVIYSYGRHFAIASHVTDLKGNAAILFTTQSYSVSTSKHISLTRRALRPDVPVFYVPEAQAGHESDNIRKMDAEVKSLLEQYAKPRIRQITHDRIAAQIASAIERRNIYGAAFVKKYKPISVPENIAELADKLLKAQIAKAKQEAKAKAQAQEAKFAEAERDLGLPRDQWADAWRDRRDVLIPNSHWYSIKNYLVEKNGTMLRLKDANTIETSKGAEFPITHAKRAFKVIADCRTSVSDWHRNGKTIHLGPFQIDSISQTGDVKAGCHTVRFAEIALMAKTLGLVVHS